LLLVGESDIAEEYQSKWTPAAVLISRFGRIASQNAYGAEDIGALVTRITSAAEDYSNSNVAATNGRPIMIPLGNSNLSVGDPAPPFSVSDLQGNVIRNEDLLGSDTLLLFWDPGCPFCQEMKDDLGRFEQNPPERAPRLLFLVSGEEEKVKSAGEGYKSLFVHDRELKVGLMLGTRATSVNVLALAGVRKASPSSASGN
jgi:hypothetical protein